ncbi:Ribulokinase [Tetrabaena socialis]|uniref:ribulose-phosphate 3-epimerase n=1 Tax=Tetrabaena socialis TaxID=47790 RepID=A0A2J8A0J8_9CHLO|nr:Ribulokinase [Tetrabaena socialis]|eukprot:PNH06036.1 Ribulokinase [Tetrabaena socialis]
MERVVIGVDGGTESLRAAVFDSTGRMLGSHASPYDTHYPEPGWAEQNPEDWWEALGEAVRGAVAAAGVAPEQVAALSVDTTCCTVVALGADGSPLRPALLWMDMRSAAQAARVAAADDPALQVNGAGRGPVSAEWMVPKSLWLAEAEPATYAAASTLCEYQDYINLRLTGRRCGSSNNMSVRWHYSTTRGVPHTLMAKLGIPDLADKWPAEVLALGDEVGGLTPAAAAHLGLPAGTLVAQGGADAFVGMIGLGVVAPGQMALLTGSSHLQLGIVGRELHGPGFFGTYQDAVLPGCHVIEGGQTSTGSVLAWFRRTCCAPGTSYTQLDAEAAAVPPGCEGLVALDHFQGNRTPYTDPLSRGALAGLSLKHGRGHVFRAFMESVAAGTALILRTMAAAGYRPDSITLAGGAARSELWLQMHADMSGVPLRLTRCADAPMLGCAILAAVAAGMYDTVPAAVAAMVAVERVMEPAPTAAAAYKAHLERYAALYPALAPIFQGGKLGAQQQPVPEQAPVAAHPGAMPSGGPVEWRGGVIVAPSILAADFANLAAAVAEAAAAGAPWVHVDLFDNSWEACPNFTVGPPVVASLRRHTCLQLDCHLAVRDPARYVDALASAGADGLTFHWEVLGGAAEVEALARRIRGAGMRAGVALAPDTPLPEELVALAQRGEVDMVLAMTVLPGFGGQSFREGVLAKVTALRAACPGLLIQVDGGMNAATGPKAVAAGANVLVAGSFLFGHKQGLAAGMRELLGAIGPADT